MMLILSIELPESFLLNAIENEYQEVESVNLQSNC